MIVVSDTSPVLNLSAISRLDLLRSLYHELVIPTAVASELQRNGLEPRCHEWLLLQEPKNRDLVKRLELRLDPGEAEAIAVRLNCGQIEFSSTNAGRGESPQNLTCDS